jgi:Tfp pilus assembly protein PilV
MNKKGLSLLEILVATILLALLTTGLANIFIAGKRYILHARMRMTGGELGKFFLEPLQRDVRQDQWGNNCLSTNGINPAGCDTNTWTDPSDRTVYSPSYNISGLLADADNPQGRLRKVIVNINWQERAP